MTTTIPETLDTPVTRLMEGDELLGRDRVSRYVLLAVREIDKHTVEVTSRQNGEHGAPERTYRMSLSHGPARLLSRRCHKCDGSGKFSLKSGHFDAQGRFVYDADVCFGCHGKGREDVSDLHRNRVYWNRYARI